MKPPRKAEPTDKIMTGNPGAPRPVIKPHPQTLSAEAGHSVEGIVLPPSNTPTLIHVGLHKTASTSLQHIWLKMANMAPMSPTFAAGMLDLLHEAVASDTVINLSPLKDEPMFLNTGDDADKWQVFSTEALSVFKWLTTPPAEVARIYFDRQVDLFTRLCPNAHILIVVREPQAWVKSIYMQYLKTGGTLTFRRFLLVHGADLRFVLAVDRLKAAWASRYGGDRVHILPFELFRDDPSHFFAELHARTGIPRPPAALLTTHLNISLNAREGEFLRKTNEFMALLTKSESLDDASRAMLNKVKPVVAATLRSEIQHHKHSLLSRTASKLTPAPAHGGLTADMQTFIRDRFIPMLAVETGDLCGYLENYANTEPVE